MTGPSASFLTINGVKWTTHSLSATVNGQGFGLSPAFGHAYPEEIRCHEWVAELVNEIKAHGPPIDRFPANFLDLEEKQEDSRLHGRRFSFDDLKSVYSLLGAVGASVGGSDRDPLPLLARKSDGGSCCHVSNVRTGLPDELPRS